MSETVHYKGVATEIKLAKGESVMAKATNILKDRDKEIASYYDNAIECLVQEFDDEYFYHPKTNKLYIISKSSHDLEEEIINAKINDDGTINYELRYYNGGAGFEECMREAFDKLDN